VVAVEENRELITNGENATGSFPFFTFIRFGKKAGCAASLIHEDILLTSSHCAIVFEGRGAYVGGTEEYGTNGDFHEDVVILQHPDYDADLAQNDVMLVKLATPSTRKPVVLNRFAKFPADGQPLTVIGFGDTKFNGNLSPTLLQANLRAFPFRACADIYLNQSELVIHAENQICAYDTTDSGKDNCQGDSGGPLLNAQGEQVGIVALGIGCGQVGVPGVYTRVSAFADWIDENVCKLANKPPKNCPTTAPSVVPSSAPSMSSVPSLVPSSRPSLGPSASSAPSLGPTLHPSVTASSPPSLGPTLRLSSEPTSVRSVPPTVMASHGPTAAPTSAPSSAPSQRTKNKSTSSDDARALVFFILLPLSIVMIVVACCLSAALLKRRRTVAHLSESEPPVMIDKSEQGYPVMSEKSEQGPGTIC
jgi:trypsin